MRADTATKHSKARLLVVDDEEANRSLLEILLVPQGYEVITAADGLAAIALLRTSNIDLLLLDLMMPKMDGIEVCRYVRVDLGNALLPIIFTTSRRDRESRVRAKEAGADDFLIKPVDSFELLVRVENLLRGQNHYRLGVEQRVALERDLAAARNKLMVLEQLGVSDPEKDAGKELLQLVTLQREALDALQQLHKRALPIDGPLHDIERVTERLTHCATQLAGEDGLGLVAAPQPLGSRNAIADGKP